MIRWMKCWYWTDQKAREPHFDPHSWQSQKANFTVS